MKTLQLNSKHTQIDKAQVTMVTAISVAVFLLIFATISVYSLAQKRTYQARVIAAREKARDQLKQNIEASNRLTESYKQFVAEQENIIGGSAVGSGDRDGDNARIILDALPSKYDYPALITSLEKIIKQQGLTIEAISGNDDEIAQLLANDSSQTVEMPFDVSVKGDYAKIQDIVKLFERSIRPFNIQEITFKTIGDNDITATIKAKSYFQPEKKLEFKSEEIK